MTEPLIGFEEVRARRLIVVGEGVYDISKFAAKHPGGEEILLLRGSDATLPLVNAHGIRGKLSEKVLPRNLKVGTIDPATLPPLDRDLRDLHRRSLERGLFRYRPSWLLFDALRGFALWAAAGLSIAYSPVLAFVLFTVARLNAIWWVHDVCHDSVFGDRARAKFWAEWVSLFFVGTTVLDYQYKTHRVHHGFTNVIDADQALDTGPVIWHRKMLERSSPRFVAIQAWVWFLVILPMTLPLFITSAIVTRSSRGDWYRIMFIVLRWAVAFVLMRSHLVLLIAPVMVAGYLLSLTASLNHFHKPIDEEWDLSFGTWVARVTQNLRERSALWSWITGGLNFHIEHHLFATMPRHNYPVIAPEVQEMFRRHGLPYSTRTIPEALRRLWQKLRNPYDGAYATPLRFQ